MFVVCSICLFYILKGENMKKLLVILLALSMTFGLAACGEKPAKEPENVPETPSLQISLDDWPIVDGATACLPFYENMAAKLLGVDVEEARQYVMCNTTTQAFIEMAEGTADLIYCLHASADQEVNAKEHGVTMHYEPFALDAFVFFVNKDNPVDSLTVDQIHDIYAGKITNWKEVGGNDEEILAYQRDEGCGSQTGLYKYVIPRDEVMDAPSEQRIADMGSIIDAVSHYDNAKSSIGYSYLYFVTNQHFDEDIKLLKVEGIEATGENIRSGSYPMVTEYCCITTEEKYQDADSVERKIIDWCVSKEGQNLAEEMSYTAAYDFED